MQLYNVNQQNAYFKINVLIHFFLPSTCFEHLYVHHRYIKLHVQYSLPDDEHTTFEICRRHEALN